MKKITRIISAVLCVALVASLAALPVSALSVAPYNSYDYDPYGGATASPLGYTPLKRVNYNDMKVVGGVSSSGTENALNRPEDMFRYNDKFFIADTGNNRIVELDSELNFVRDYTVFASEDGSTSYDLLSPRDVFVKDDEMYVVCNRTIADENGVNFKDGYIVVADMDGTYKRYYGKPEADAVDFRDYEPLTVVVDNSGYLYIRALGVLEGLIILDKHGEFVQYYGANKVVMSFALAIQVMWKKVFGRKSTATTIKAVPTEMSNIFIDPEGFIYTTTSTNTVAADLRLRKLNPVGDNVLAADANAIVSTVYGDRSSLAQTALEDVYVDENEMIAVVDTARSRIFIYDNRSVQLTVFGVGSEQLGGTSYPTAITKYNDYYYVLDQVDGSITIYKPTDYMKKLLIADSYYREGEYVKGEQYWREVLKYNSNFSIAYAAIGKSLLEKEKYQECLAYLKYGQDRTSYSAALAEYRKEYVRDNFYWFVPLIVACGVGLLSGISLAQSALGIKKKKQSIKFK